MMRILLVDDDPIALEIMKEALSSYDDYEIETSTDGVEALSRILTGEIPLVISDWMMPCMSGVDLCRYVRRADLPQYVYIILITGREGAADVVEGLAAGADEYLQKPISPAELNARVRSIQRMKGLHDKIQEQNEQLRNVQRFKNDWINMVVHDLRSPMSAILGFAALAEARATPEVKKWLSTLNQEAQRVNGMLEQMLIVAKSEDQELGLATTRADVTRLAVSASVTMQPVAEAKDVGLHIVCPDDPCLAELDTGLMRRVLENLLSNAIRYSPAGSRVEIELRREDGQLVLEVADQGPGVPEQDRQRIFERYATADAGPSGKSSYGLGLAYCRIVAQAHGGQICCLPNRPRGTRFAVRLPDADRSAETGDLDAPTAVEAESLPLVKPGRLEAGGLALSA